jgi:hypothetical protein
VHSFPRAAQPEHLNNDGQIYTGEATKRVSWKNPLVEGVVVAAAINSSDDDGIESDSRFSVSSMESQVPLLPSDVAWPCEDARLQLKVEALELLRTKFALQAKSQLALLQKETIDRRHGIRAELRSAQMEPTLKQCKRLELHALIGAQLRENKDKAIDLRERAFQQAAEMVESAPPEALQGFLAQLRGDC